mmetsp:Transcript_126254/g.252202  ORF Transcript_126254/g.252202 Transcript_126254/m.252202 type:complete len:201 (-) Transcript_126254:76-678(-)
MSTTFSVTSSPQRSLPPIKSSVKRKRGFTAEPISTQTNWPLDATFPDSACPISSCFTAFIRPNTLLPIFFLPRTSFSKAGIKITPWRSFKSIFSILALNFSPGFSSSISFHGAFNKTGFSALMSQSVPQPLLRRMTASTSSPTENSSNFLPATEPFMVSVTAPASAYKFILLLTQCLRKLGMTKTFEAFRANNPKSGTNR